MKPSRPSIVLGAVVALACSPGGPGTGSADAAAAGAPDSAANGPDSVAAPDAASPIDTAPASVEAAPREDDAADTTPDAGRDAPAAPGDTGSEAPVLPRDAESLAARREGFWRGQTSQGLPITLTIDSVGILEIEYGWQVGPCSSTTRTTFASALPIDGDRFMRMLPGGPGGVRTVITGTFSGAEALEGTLDITAIPIPNVPSCSGTAHATYSASPHP